LLSANGNVKQDTPTRWTVQSDSTEGVTYYIDASGCTCPDAKKRQSICKHGWASIGYAAAVAIVALRDVESSDQAEQIIDEALTLTIDLPLGYRRTLQDEYELALKRLGGFPGYNEWSTEIEAKNEPKAEQSAAPGPIFVSRDCNHAACHTTRCDQDFRVGGIAI
jgi:hypothetical protein